MGIAKNLVGAMVIAILATIAFGGPPPMFEIMLGTIAIVTVGLIVWSDLGDERALRNRRAAQDAIEGNSGLGHDDLD